MSAVRIPGPDGRIVLVPVDDGAVGRLTHTRRAIRGGALAIGGGAIVVVESARAHKLAQQRAAMGRQRETFR